MNTQSAVRHLRILPIGGSTAIIEIGAWRLITDPTLDPPSRPGPDDTMPRRTVPPALAPTDLGPLDGALVSHDQHPDNLDAGGRALLATLPVVLTTPEGAARLGGSARGLKPFEHLEIEDPDGQRLRITALPARHGPEGAQAVMGPVVGFLLSGTGLPSVYVSGDNASLEVVREIVARIGPVDVAVLFTGGVSVPQYFDGSPLTLTNSDAVKAARLLEAGTVVPIHCDGWTHYRQSSASLVEEFTSAGLDDVLVVVPAGQATNL